MAIESHRKLLKPRGRKLGIPFDGVPGTFNAGYRVEAVPRDRLAGVMRKYGR